MIDCTSCDRVANSLQPGDYLIQENAKSMPVLVDIRMTGFCKLSIGSSNVTLADVIIYLHIQPL